jgi:hypothetical protein
LFIDEAYYLYRVGDSLDYGQEVIDILLQVMENDRDKLVVILAGYKDRMDEFFTSRGHLGVVLEAKRRTEWYLSSGFRRPCREPAGLKQLAEVGS